MIAFLMEILKTSKISIADVFKEYSDPDMDFYKTRIPVKLMEYEGEAFPSTSKTTNDQIR